MVRFCSLYSGSSGNAIFYSAGQTRILVDAGVSAKRITGALISIGERPEGLSAILITHEHIDHMRGVRVFSNKYGIPVYANMNTWSGMIDTAGLLKPCNIRYFETGTDFCIEGVTVRSFPVSHDAVEPVGFSFHYGGRKVTTATDIGYITRELVDSIEDSDLLLLESNHDVEMLKVGPYPWPLKQRILGDKGHLSNEAAGKVVAHLARKGTKRFLLGHLSKENNFPELAYQTVCNALLESDFQVGTDVTLDIALRDKVGRVVEL